MKHIIAVSKQGANAFSTNPNDFIFNSLYNTFKIIATGSYSPTIASGGFTEAYNSLAHGQSITPFVIAFCKFANGRVAMPGHRASNEEFYFTNLWVDATNIHFGYINNTGSNRTPTYRYFICETPL